MSEANWSVPALSGLQGWFPLSSAPTNQGWRPLKDAGVVVQVCTWWQETKDWEYWPWVQSPKTKWVIKTKKRKTISELLSPRINCKWCNLRFVAIHHWLSQPASEYIFPAGRRQGNSLRSPNIGRQEGRAKGRRPLMQREDADALSGGPQRQQSGLAITYRSSNSKFLYSLTFFCWCWMCHIIIMVWWLIFTTIFFALCDFKLLSESFSSKCNWF